MKLDLSAAKPYLDAIRTAESLPALMVWLVDHPQHEYLLDEAMDEVNEHCPWLWPAIDRAVLRTMISV